MLATLRETKHMIASLQEKEKRLKSEVGQLHEQGKLDGLVDPDDPQKFNGDSVSVSLCKGLYEKDAFTTPPFRWRSTPSKRRLIGSSTWPTGGSSSPMSSRLRTGA